MAITLYAAGIIQVNSGKLDGTATGGTTTTLVDSTKSWTTDQWAGYALWHKPSKQFRRIASNTATTLTIQSWYPWTTTPVNTDAYSIGYLKADIQAANDAGGWGLCVSNARGRDLIINGMLYISSGGFVGMDLGAAVEILGLTTQVSCRIRQGGTYMQGGIYQDGAGNLVGANGGSLWVGDYFAHNYTYLTLGTDIGNSILLGTSLSGYRNQTGVASFFSVYSETSPQSALPDAIDIRGCTGNGVINLGAVNNNGAAGSYTTIDNNIASAQNSFPMIRVGTAQVIYNSRYVGIGMTGTSRPVSTNNPSTYTGNTWNGYYHPCPYLIGSIAGAGVANGQLTHTFINAETGTNTEAPVYSYSGNLTAYDPIVDMKTSWMPYPRYSNTFVTGGTWSIKNGSGTLVYAGSMDGATTQDILWRRSTPNVGNTTYTNTNYGDFSINFFRYGYKLQSATRVLKICTRFGNDAGAVKFGEAFNHIANTFVVASESTAWAYTGITINGAAQTIAVSGTRTTQELYDYTQAWLNQSTNVQYGEGLTTADGANLVITTGWSFTISGSLTYAHRLSGAIILPSAGTYSPKLGTATLTFSAAGTYDLRGSDITGIVTLVNTSGGAVTVKLPIGTSYTNSGPNITIELSKVVTLSLTSVVTGSRVRIEKTSDGSLIADGTVSSGTTFSASYTYTADLGVTVIVRKSSAAPKYLEYRFSTAITVLGLSLMVTQTADTIAV